MAEMPPYCPECNHWHAFGDCSTNCERCSTQPARIAELSADIAAAKEQARMEMFRTCQPFNIGGAFDAGWIACRAVYESRIASMEERLNRIDKAIVAKKN